MWWRRTSEAWTRRPDIPSWFPNVFAVAIFLGVAALLLPALRKGGSYTNSYEKLADVTGVPFGTHVERFRSRRGGFYFAIPVPTVEQFRGSTPSFTGVVKVSSHKKQIAQYEFIAILHGARRLHLETNGGGEVSTLFLMQFNGERLPKEFRSGKSFDFEFQLSSLPATNALLVQEYWHTPGRSESKAPSTRR